MGKNPPKLGTSSDGRPMHYSVGALIERDGRYLLIDRNIEPYGWAAPAGHVDEGETPEYAMVRKVLEEVKLNVDGYELLFEEELGWNRCNKGVGAHYWYVFACKAYGQVETNAREAKGSGWYLPEEIRRFGTEDKLEPAWKHFFEKPRIV